jgi:hypothetical protein
MAKPGKIIERDGARYRLLTRLERGKASKGNWWAVPVDEADVQVGIEMVEVEPCQS